MALNIPTNIKNSLNGYTVDASQVKGTYVAVSTLAARDSLPKATVIKGSLCYVEDTDITYIYNGSEWTDASSYKIDGGLIE